ncbi:MAG: fumarylacetoacetate hydrolase family protein, partial [Myxococcota bacterium]
EPVQSQAPPIPLSDLHLLPPSAPSKIVCVGLNYRHHAEEMNKPIPAEPLIFLKAPSALLSPMEPIILPDASALVHHEGEMAVVIGQRTCRVTEAEAMGCILGVTCMNDVTARDIQRREGGRYSRAKGFDTFAPCGPSLTLGVDPNDLEVSCAVNGHVRQRSSTRDLIFSVETVIAFVSSIMTLMPGDIISTGTPSGVGPLVDGDHVSVEVSGVGVLNNPVKALQ